jgi:hypothetical protein
MDEEAVFDLRRLLDICETASPLSDGIPETARTIAALAQKITSAKTAAERDGRRLSVFEQRMLGKAMGALLSELGSLTHAAGLAKAYANKGAADKSGLLSPGECCAPHANASAPALPLFGPPRHQHGDELFVLDGYDSSVYHSGPEASFGRRRFIPEGHVDSRDLPTLQHLTGSPDGGTNYHHGHRRSDGSPIFFKAAISVSSHDQITASSPVSGQHTSMPTGGSARPVITIPSQQTGAVSKVVYVLDRPRILQFVQHVLSLDPQKFTSDEFEELGIRWCIPGITLHNSSKQATPFSNNVQLEGSARSRGRGGCWSASAPGSPSPRPSRVSSSENVDEAGESAGGQLSRRSSARGSPALDLLPLVPEGQSRVVLKSEFADFVQAVLASLADVSAETGQQFL